MLRTICRRLRGPWVTEDPHPTPTGLDRIGGTYPTHDQVADAIRRGTTTLRTYPTTLLKPQDVERVTREVMALLDGAAPVPYWPATIAPHDRYWQCTDDCTTDCGACKGGGRPAGEVGDVDAIREARTGGVQR